MRAIVYTVLSLAASGVVFHPAMAEKASSSLQGNLSSVGSDTLNNLMTFWAEEFRKQNPRVNVQVEGKGSSTAPTALIEGVAQLGPMSRPMKNTEIEAFEKKYKFPPTPIAVAVDSLAVYVHLNNPIAKKGLTLPQIDAIFSKSRKGGYPEDLKTWGQLGLDGVWKNKPISVYGRNSASGTYGFFKDVALFKGDFKNSVKEQPGSATVVNGVAGDLGGIGYSGIGFKTPDVQVVPIAKAKGQAYVPATFEAAISGEYPLGRSLLVYIVKEPGKPLPKIVGEFVKFILSAKGQEIVVKDGYGKLPPAVIDSQLNKLGLTAAVTTEPKSKHAH